MVAYQKIQLQGKDNVVCTQMYDGEGREYQREWAQGVRLLVCTGLSVVQDSLSECLFFSINAQIV